jgi:hypothetical protein
MRSRFAKACESSRCASRSRYPKPNEQRNPNQIGNILQRLLILLLQFVGV